MDDNTTHVLLQLIQLGVAVVNAAVLIVGSIIAYYRLRAFGQKTIETADKLADVTTQAASNLEVATTKAAVKVEAALAKKTDENKAILLVHCEETANIVAGMQAAQAATDAKIDQNTAITEEISSHLKAQNGGVFTRPSHT